MVIPEATVYPNRVETDLLEVMQRLINVVEDETDCLRVHDVSQLASQLEKKNRILLEFKRAQKTLIGVGESSALISRAKVLKAAIGRNQSAIKLHLSATKEFANFLEEENRRHETDGTYSRLIGINGVNGIIV